MKRLIFRYTVWRMTRAIKREWKVYGVDRGLCLSILLHFNDGALVWFGNNFKEQSPYKGLAYWLGPQDCHDAHLRRLRFVEKFRKKALAEKVYENWIYVW